MMDAGQRTPPDDRSSPLVVGGGLWAVDKKKHRTVRSAPVDSGQRKPDGQVSPGEQWKVDSGQRTPDKNTRSGTVDSGQRKPDGQASPSE